MNTIQLELLELVAAVKKFQDDYLPAGCHLSIDSHGPFDSATIQVHTQQEHPAGLQVKRILGVEDVAKTNYNTDHIWHTLIGKISEKVTCNIYCIGLPPMCRIEEYEEEIPAEKVIQTGEKTVVKRTRICCGEGK